MTMMMILAMMMSMMMMMVTILMMMIKVGLIKYKCENIPILSKTIQSEFQIWEPGPTLASGSA